MGLFSSKKKDNNYSQNLGSMALPSQQDLPEFPDADENEVNAPLPEFPNYESSIANIKNAVEENEEGDFKIPQREERSAQKVMASTEREIDDEKPVFVKIDRYKDALNNLKMLKEKLGEAEELLKSIEDVRTQEQQKVEEWKKDVQNIKDKLLSIDNKLFGA